MDIYPFLYFIDCDKKLIDDLKLPSELMKPGEKLQSFANYLTYLLYKSDAVNSDRVVTHIDMDVVTFEACFGTQGFAYKLALVVNQVCFNLHRKNLLSNG